MSYEFRVQIECHTERSRSAEKGKRVQSLEFRVLSTAVSPRVFGLPKMYRERLKCWFPTNST
jgi:hypothetical protein